MIRRRPPAGVVAIAAILFLFGAALAYAGFLAGVAAISTGRVMTGMLVLLTPQAAIVAAIGLALLQRWAVSLTVIMLLLLGGRAALDASVEQSTGNLSRLAVSILVIAGTMWYLTRPRVKDAFQAAPSVK